MKTDNALGLYLHRRKRSCGDLARAVGAAPSQISRIVSGQCRPSVELAIDIEDATGGEVPVSTWKRRWRKSTGRKVEGRGVHARRLARTGT